MTQNLALVLVATVLVGLSMYAVHVCRNGFSEIFGVTAAAVDDAAIIGFALWLAGAIAVAI